jgi:hypothetical protein
MGYVTDGPLGRYQKTRVPRLVWDARWRLEVGSLLPPSGGPTPELMFRVRLDPGAATNVRVITSRNEAADGSKEVEFEM